MQPSVQICIQQFHLQAVRRALAVKSDIPSIAKTLIACGKPAPRRVSDIVLQSFRSATVSIDMEDCPIISIGW